MSELEASASDASSSAAGTSQPRAVRRNGLVMLLGAVTAQALTLMVMPVLTRLFSAEAIAAQAVFVAASASLVVIATLRMDLAIVLPKRDEDALRLLGLVFYQALSVGGLICLVALAASAEVGNILGLNVSARLWLCQLALMVLVAAIAQASIGICTRYGTFTVVAASGATASATFALVAIVLGLAFPWDLGMVTARLAGQIAAAVLLIALGGVAITRALRTANLATARELWSKNRPFIVFNTPYSLVGAFTRDFPLFAFATLGGAHATASYALARTFTLAPATLAAAALSSVFYREAALRLGTPEFRQLATTLTRAGMFVSAPIFALLFIWGDEIFATVFGQSWREAGEFAQRLAIPLWLALQSGWLERMFEAAGRQRVAFTIQMSFDALQVSVVFGVLYLTGDPMVTVTCYAAIYTAYSLVYLVAVYHVAGFGLAVLARFLLIGGALFAAVAVMFLAVRLAFPTSLLIFALLASAVGIVSAGLAGLLVRADRRRATGVDGCSTTTKMRD